MNGERHFDADDDEGEFFGGRRANDDDEEEEEDAAAFVEAEDRAARRAQAVQAARTATSQLRLEPRSILSLAAATAYAGTLVRWWWWWWWWPAGGVHHGFEADPASSLTRFSSSSLLAADGDGDGDGAEEVEVAAVEMNGNSGSRLLVEEKVECIALATRVRPQQQPLCTS